MVGACESRASWILVTRCLWALLFSIFGISYVTPSWIYTDRLFHVGRKGGMATHLVLGKK